MPCYRCGTRQIDPERGSSPWRRGVRTDRQVLICPDCQASADWIADLDRCRECTSVHLVRRLGEVECRDCGSVAEAGVSPVRATTLGGLEHADARLGFRLGARLGVPLAAADVAGMAASQDLQHGPALSPGQVPVPPSPASVPPGPASVPPGPASVLVGPASVLVGPASVPPSLADEVEEALARVFGRAARASGISAADT
jgi:hypothetical protein